MPSKENLCQKCGQPIGKIGAMMPSSYPNHLCLECAEKIILPMRTVDVARREWEEEFNKKFVLRPFESDGDWAWSTEANPSEIKNFIARELLRQKEELEDKWQSDCQFYYEEGRKAERERVAEIIEKAETQLHGGGNGRRLFITLLSEIKKGV